MSEDEQERFEQQYLSNPELLNALHAAERDLIDSYVRGELDDPAQFEKYYLTSPVRQSKVEFARALIRALDQAPRQNVRQFPVRSAIRSRRLLPAFLWAAAALLVLTVGLFLNRQEQKTPLSAGQPQDRPAGQVLPVPQTSPAPPERQPTPLPTPLQVATFVLTPLLTRDTGEPQTLRIEDNVELNLELQLEANDYDSYDAVLRTPEGEEIARQVRLKPLVASSGPAISLRVPAGRLAIRDYIIKVTGGARAEDVASYYFRVRR